MSIVTEALIKADIAKEEIFNFLGLPLDFSYGNAKISFLEEEIYISIHYSGYQNNDKESEELGEHCFGYVTLVMIEYSEYSEEIAEEIVKKFGGGYVIPNDYDSNNFYYVEGTKKEQ